MQSVQSFKIKLSWHFTVRFRTKISSYYIHFLGKMEKNALSLSNNRGKFSDVSLLNPLIPVYDVLPTKCQMGAARGGCHAVPDTALREREERTPGETRSVTPCHAASRNGTAGARVELFRRSRPGGRVGRRRAVRNTTSAIQVRWRTGRPPAGGSLRFKA